MQTVMRARTPYGIQKSDVTTTVANFFEDKIESRFNKGTHSTMPVDDGWINDTLDKDKFTEWIFKNRNQVWYMLYGSISINEASKPYLGN